MSRSFRRSEQGVAAVEFALIAPVLAVGIIGLADVADLGFQRTQMHTALRSGAQYFMAGGTNPDAAEEVIKKSWKRMPPDAVVEASLSCTCAGVAASCTTLCADGSYPNVFYHIEATANLGNVFGIPTTIDEDVRAR